MYIIVYLIIKYNVDQIAVTAKLTNLSAYSKTTSVIVRYIFVLKLENVNSDIEQYKIWKEIIIWRQAAKQVVQFLEIIILIGWIDYVVAAI